VTIRICGDLACFMRPETKVKRGIYPIITPRPARGVLEAIVWEPQMYDVIASKAVVT
jgi:CRISPR-associated protein Cas5d